MPDDPKPKQDEPNAASKAETAECPLVFVSHDSRDGDLAEAFANLLQDASGGVLKSFRSSDRKGTDGIEFGAEWYRTIMDKLDSATDVVALLTDRSLDRPWILYETGVAKGKLDTTVLGLALGVPLNKVSTGPFAQFQNSDDDEDSITKLVLQLIRRHPQAAPREEAVKRQVRAFLDEVEELFKDRKSGPNAEKDAQQVGVPDESRVAKLFEEVKVLVRGMPERVANEIRSSPQRSKSHLRRFHPGMLRISPDDDGLVGLLVALSMIKDEFPWLYDMGLELYRAALSGDPEAVDSSRSRFREAVDMMVHGPGEMLLDSQESHESLMFIRHAINELDDGPLLRKRIWRRPKSSSSDD